MCYKINYNIYIQDYEGNSQTISNSFVYDNGFVQLIQFNPTENSYTNNNEVTFKLSDHVSGIKSILIDGIEISQNNCIINKNSYECNYVFNFNQGKNTIIIETVDNANNQKLITHSLYYDDISPIINRKDYSFEIIESSPISIIRVNGHNFDASGCSNKDHIKSCTYNEKINSIYVKDEAGNFAEI